MSENTESFYGIMGNLAKPSSLTEEDIKAQVAYFRNNGEEISDDDERRAILGLIELQAEELPNDD